MPRGSSRKAGPIPNPRARLIQFRRLLLGDVASASGDNEESPPNLPPHKLSPQHPTGIDHLTSNFSPTEYLHAVRRAIEYIHAGDVFQVNLCPAATAPGARLADRPLLPAPRAEPRADGRLPRRRRLANRQCVARAVPESCRPACGDPADQGHRRSHPRRRCRPQTRSRAHTLGEESRRERDDRRPDAQRLDALLPTGECPRHAALRTGRVRLGAAPGVGRRRQAPRRSVHRSICCAALSPAAR